MRHAEHYRDNMSCSHPHVHAVLLLCSSPVLHVHVHSCRLLVTPAEAEPNQQHQEQQEQGSCETGIAAPATGPDAITASSAASTQADQRKPLRCQ